MAKKLEGFQRINKWHKEKETEHGTRVCTEVGVISGLDNEVRNYILTPSVDDNGDIRSWDISPMPKETPEEFDDIVLKSITEVRKLDW